MFKNLGQMASLLRQAQQIGGKVQEMNERLKSRRVSGSAGAGMVQVEANGLGEVVRVIIEPSLIEKGEREIIEDLLPAAINQAVVKARQLQSESLQEAAGGLNLSMFGEAFGQMAGAEEEEEKESEDE